MSVPQPPSSIKGHCAAIDHDILYVFDEDKLQSLPLKKNATWSEKSYGQSVSSPACVKVVPEGDEDSAALWVVGGDTDNGDYPGLQRYFFGNDSWETLHPTSSDLRTRTNHSITYLNDSQTILVYGGSPADAPSFLSSQTFSLSTVEPYIIDSFVSSAPPTNNAILTPWNSSHAVMVGGTETNTDVWLFHPGQDVGWQQLPTNLSEPLNDASRADIIDGSDGSKVLQVYNFHVSPNTVQNIVLQGAGGTVVDTGVTVGSDSTSAQQKRDLTLAEWPSYNSSNAPTSTRTDCSISRSADGKVVMAGGNDDDPLILYNQNDNSWIDASQFFDSKQQQPLIPSSTPTASTPTATPSPTESAPPILGNGSAHDKTMRTLGITLGTLCGIAAIFILVLLYLRWRKLKAKKANGGYLEEKDGQGRGERMSFQDRGASFMKEAGMSNTDLAPPSHPYGATHNSHSSLAIIAGKFGNNKRYTGANHSAKGSFESTTHLVKDREGNLVPSENVEMMDIGDKTPAPRGSAMLAVPGAVAHGTSVDKETRAERKRSSGWSRYFATSTPNDANGLSHIPSVYVKPNTLSVGSRYSQDERTPSQDSRIPSSALVPPLDIDFSKTVDGQRLSHVAQGSPIVGDSREDLARHTDSVDIPEAQRAVIVDPADPRKSQATSISSYGNRSTLGSTVSSDFYEQQVPWTPMSGGGNFKDHLNDRPPSSAYSASLYDSKDRRPSRGKGAGFFPGAGTNYKPQKVKMSHAAGPSSDWASPRMPAAKAEQNRDSGASNITVFPGLKDFEPATPQKKENKPAAQQAEQRQSNLNQDMSWLNLKQ